MKKLLIGAALAAMLASPAFAQAYDPDFPSGNLVPAPGALLYGNQGGDAFAYAPTHSQMRRLRGVRAEAFAPRSGRVYEQGQYAGQDPDPNVRLELRRDWADINE